LGERLVRNEEVSGSIPLSSTSYAALGAAMLDDRTAKIVENKEVSPFDPVGPPEAHPVQTCARFDQSLSFVRSMDGEGARMQGSEFSYDTTVGDLQALQSFMMRQVFVRNRRDYLIALAGVVLCAIFLTTVIVLSASPRTLAMPRSSGSFLVSYLSLIAVLLTGAVLALLPMVRLRLRTVRMQVSQGGPLVGPTSLSIGVEGLMIARKLMTTTYSWGAFRRVTVEKGAVILVIDNGMGVIVPAGAFQSDGERFEFAAEISRRIAAAQPT
jgi:hypothetical protein